MRGHTGLTKVLAAFSALLMLPTSFVVSMDNNLLTIIQLDWEYVNVMLSEYAVKVFVHMYRWSL